MSSMKAFARQGTLVFAGLIAANVFTYVFYATVSRAVGVNSAGLFLSLVSAIMIASLPATVGGNVMAKMAAEALGRGQAGVVTALGAYAFLLLGPVALAVLFVLAVGMPAIERFFHADDGVVIALAGAAFALSCTLLLQRAVLQGAGRFGAFVSSNVIEGVVKAATGIATWTLHGGLREAIGGYVLATAAATGYGAARLRDGAPRMRPHLPRAVVARHLVGIALPTAALSAVSFADVVLVRHSLDAYASGLYAATALFGRAVLTALAFVPTVLMPRVVAERAAGRSARRLLALALAATAVSMLVVLAAAAYAPALLLTIVAGRAFVAATPLMISYTAAMGALAGSVVLTAYLIALDRTGFALPLVAVACSEIGAIAVYHPDAAAVVHIVLVGHCVMFACCAVDAAMSLRLGNAAQPSERSSS